MNTMIDFDVDSCLGIGAFGDAYLVHSRIGNTLYADVLKVPAGIINSKLLPYQPQRKIKPNLEQNLGLLQREHEALKRIQGHSAIPVLRPYTTYSKLFTKYESSITLSMFIQKYKQVAFEKDGSVLIRYAGDCIKVGYDIVSALEYMAHKGIGLHGDLKPDNVVVRRDADKIRAWIIDFGCSVDKELLNNPSSLLWFAEHVYIAPEIRDPDEPLPAPNSDVYSVGKILYKALSRFGSLYKEDKVFVLCSVEEHFKNMGIGNQIDQVLLPMLIKHPQKRFSLAQAQDCLGKLLLKLYKLG